jgi:hypothetical protein
MPIARARSISGRFGSLSIGDFGNLLRAAMDGKAAYMQKPLTDSKDGKE